MTDYSKMTAPLWIRYANPRTKDRWKIMTGKELK